MLMLFPLNKMQRNISMSPCDYYFFLFPYISSHFHCMYLSLFGVRSLMVYDVCHLCGLYRLSRKIFHFASFRKIK